MKGCEHHCSVSNVRGGDWRWRRWEWTCVAEGAARASRTSRSSTLLRVAPRSSSCLPHHHPSPLSSRTFSLLLFLPWSRRPPGTGVASRRGWRRRRRWSGLAEEEEEEEEEKEEKEKEESERRGFGLGSEPRSILASPAGWTRPDIAFRSLPSRQYQTTLPMSRTIPPPVSSPATGPSLFPSFRLAAASWSTNHLGVYPRDLHPTNRVSC